MTQENTLQWLQKSAACLIFMVVLLWQGGSISAEMSAQELIAKMEYNYAKIENYQVDVSRFHYRGELVESREEWRYSFHTPLFTRIEITLPKKVTLIITQDDAWQHFVEEKKIVRRKIKGLAEKAKMVLIGYLLRPYEIEGWGLSISSQFGDRLQLLREETVKGRTCYLIQCKPQGDTASQVKLLLWIDRERETIVKRGLYGEDGKLVSETENDNFLEIIPGIWLPRKVDTILHTDKGKVIRQLVLRNIKLNESLPEATFQFTPPEGSKVTTLNERGEVVKDH